MSNRERAIELLEQVPDYKIEFVIAYLQGMTAGAEEPNAETLETFAEVDEMKRTGAGEHFEGSTKDLFAAILEG